MNKLINPTRGDPTPVTGGVRASARLLRPFRAKTRTPKDQLGKHIAMLISLHDSVAAKYGDVNLLTMSDTAKQQLLRNINRMLGIKSVAHSFKPVKPKRAR